MERTSDQRKVSRFNLQDKMPIQIDSPFESGKSGEITNLGFGGVFLSAPPTYPVGSLLALTIPLDDKVNAIRVSSKVVRVDEGKGTGIEFTNLSAKNAERIGAYFFLNMNS